jgi:hypothetical protein
MTLEAVPSVIVAAVGSVGSVDGSGDNVVWVPADGVSAVGETLASGSPPVHAAAPMRTAAAST